MIMYYVYILQSTVKETYYTGSSNNPERRLFFHNAGREKYTKRYRPWKLAFQHAFDTKSEALEAEQKIKNWKSKKMIRRLINGDITLDE